MRLYYPCHAVVCPGFAVARELHLPLDVIVARKVGVPWQPELAMGAIAGGTRVLDLQTIGELGISDADVERIVASEQSEMRRREKLYREGKAVPDLRGRMVILVDDGLAIKYHVGCGPSRSQSEAGKRHRRGPGGVPGRLQSFAQ